MNETVFKSVALSLVSFGLGTLFGYIIRGYLEKYEGGTKHESQLVLIAVTVMWVVSVTYDIVSLTYETSPFIHGLMGAIVGFFYTKGAKNEK